MEQIIGYFIFIGAFVFCAIVLVADYYRCNHPELLKGEVEKNVD